MNITSDAIRLSRLILALVVMAFAYVPLSCAAACDHASGEENSAEKRADIFIQQDLPSQEQAIAKTACASCCAQVFVEYISEVSRVKTHVKVQIDLAETAGAAPPGMVFRPPIV
ncbi:MAG: hypothetical protein AAGH90_13475 [Pseudomonadota bacterium]|mgnify:CR=1|jgi:hypothetical protein